MVFGILQRYVMGQVLRNFLLALLAITIIFTLFVVMAEATRNGLAPQDVVGMVPFIIPGSLTYTIPVSLLFAVTVVYGRLAGDNEIVAIKTAGLSAMTVLKPALSLGAILSVILFLLSSQVIPRANNALSVMIFGSLEDTLYKFLKKEGEINNPRMPFYIQVRDVQGRDLIDPVFRHRAPSPAPPGTFDLTVRARRARIEFDTEAMEAIVNLVDAESTGQTDRPFLMWLSGRRVLKFPLEKAPEAPEKRVMEMTDSEIKFKQHELRAKILRERKRQAAFAGMFLGAGLFQRVDWNQVRVAYVDFNYWKRQYDDLETEKHVRVALSAGSFFFVLLGAPVGILFAKRDFLSAFISCFIPIIIVYYPLVLATMNMGKEGILPPYGVFAGDAVLAVLAGFFAIPPIRKH
ncbi:MAG TPA: LptF/LptG family permease [Isosphaeraceae bacterium]|nr:LptF/LptG family permease [Isosphaeraceae bacterium]